MQKAEIAKLKAEKAILRNEIGAHKHASKTEAKLKSL